MYPPGQRNWCAPPKGLHIGTKGCAAPALPASPTTTTPPATSSRGPRGYESGGTTREFFAVLCSECGNQAQVPFRPRMDRPVYCSDCFRKARPE